MNLIDQEFCMNFVGYHQFEPISPIDNGYIGHLIFKYYYKGLYSAIIKAPPEYIPWKRIPRKTKKQLNHEETQRLPANEIEILQEWLSKSSSNVEHFKNLGVPTFVISLIAEYKRYEGEREMKSWATLQNRCPALRSIN